MLANATPLLQNQALCQFLGNMDEREVRILREEGNHFAQEDQRLNNMLSQLEQEYSWTNIFRNAALVAAGLSIISGVGRLIFERTEWAELQYKGASFIEWDWYKQNEEERRNNIGKTSIKQGLVSAIFSGIFFIGKELVIYSHTKKELLHHIDLRKREVTSEINGNRVLRLKQKVREIERRLPQLQDALESNQLSIASDYFNRKASEIEVDLANRVFIQVRHYHYG